MREHEAEEVIGALETGRRFECSNNYAGVREVLEFDLAEGRFALTVYHAYKSSTGERRLFTREELAARLRESFSYQSFDLPRSMPLCPPPPRADRAEELASLEKMIAALEREIRE
jgi:hypothetical protein